MAEYRVQVGTIGDRPYFITVSTDPSFDRIEAFAVVLSYNDPALEREVQIARIDTAHGTTHIDKLYADEQGTEPIDVDVWDAQAYLEDNWRRFARLYRENHE